MKFRRNILTDMVGDLSKFDFVGITEKYDESIKKLEDILNIKFGNLLSYNVVKHKSKYKPTEEELMILNLLVKRDMKLYNKAMRSYK